MARSLHGSVGVALFCAAVLCAPLLPFAESDPAAQALRGVAAAKRNLAKEQRDVKRAEKEVAKVQRDPNADRGDLKEARADLKEERLELKAAAKAYVRAEQKYQALNNGVVSDADLYESVTTLMPPSKEEPPSSSQSLPEIPDGREMTAADLGESAALESGLAASGGKGRESLPAAYATAAARARSPQSSSDSGAPAAQVDFGAPPQGRAAQEGAGPLLASAAGGAGRSAGQLPRAPAGGRRDDALGAVRTAFRADPAAADKHLARSQALARSGRWSEAEREALEAVRLDDQNGAAWRALSWSQLHLGKYSEAEAAASRALTLNALDAEAYALRAFAFEHLGKRDAMLSDLRRAALLDPRRFKRLLKRAEKGLSVFDANDKESWRLLEGEPEAPEGARGLGRTAAAAGVLVALGLLAVRRRMRVPAAAVPDPIAEAERAGLLAGKYQLRGRIASGESAEVWEAQDISLGRSATLKKVDIPAGPGTDSRRASVFQEAKTLGSLRHPNIVDIYEVLDIPAGLYLVFEHLQGDTLQQILAKEKRLSWARVKAILQPVCTALEFAHQSGFAHRNLNPSNIMVTADGGVKIVDFAIAGVLADGDRAVDICALGRLVYEAVIGERPPPLGPGSMEHAFQRLRELAQDMPPEAAQAVSAVLNPEPSKRPLSAQSFRLGE